MTVKGYGNYLGLAQLQAYLAAATGFVSGELMVTSGHAIMELHPGDSARLESLLATYASVGAT